MQFITCCPLNFVSGTLFRQQFRRILVKVSLAAGFQVGTSVRLDLTVRRAKVRIAETTVADNLGRAVVAAFECALGLLVGRFHGHADGKRSVSEKRVAISR